MPIDECPSRSLTTFAGIPAASAIDACPDGRELVVALHDAGVAATFDVPSGRRRAVVRLAGGVHVRGGVTYRPDGGTFVFTTIADGTGIVSIVVVDDATGAIIDEHQADDTFSGIAYVSRGRRLATIGDAHGDADAQLTTLDLWDAEGLFPIGAGIELPGIQTAIWSSPDGTHLWMLDSQGTITVWDLRPHRWVEAACELTGRSLTRAEWNRYLHNTRYDPVCRVR